MAPALGRPRPVVTPAIEAKVARLGRGRDLKTRCTWPGGTLEFDFRVLTQAERVEADDNARKALSARGIDPDVDSELVWMERATHILALAICDADTGKPLFDSGDELARCATEDELSRLAKLYARHRTATDPDLDALTDDEVAEIEECLKKKDLTALSNIVSCMRPSCLPTLVSLLAISLISKSSSTTHESASPSSDDAISLAPTPAAFA